MGYFLLTEKTFLLRVFKNKFVKHYLAFHTTLQNTFVYMEGCNRKETSLYLGLNCVHFPLLAPRKDMLKTYPSLPLNMTLHGNRTVADVIS